MDIEDIIETIPGEGGWWESDSEEKYREACQLLIRFNMSDHDIANLLSELYWAAVNEHSTGLQNEI